MVYICNPSYSGGGGRRIMSLRPVWRKIEAKLCFKKYLY
jgi:hypothetical protein